MYIDGYSESQPSVSSLVFGRWADSSGLGQYCCNSDVPIWEDMDLEHAGNHLFKGSGPPTTVRLHGPRLKLLES